MNLVKTAEIYKMGKINSAIYRIERARANFLKTFSSRNCKKILFGELMGNVMNLFNIYSLIVSSSPFIVKLYELTKSLLY